MGSVISGVSPIQTGPSLPYKLGLEIWMNADLEIFDEGGWSGGFDPEDAGLGDFCDWEHKKTVVDDSLVVIEVRYGPFWRGSIFAANWLLAQGTGPVAERLGREGGCP